MAFDTVNERIAVAFVLGMPAPFALPEGAGAFSSEMACVLLQMFPTASLGPPVEPEPVLGGSSSSYQITRLKLLRVLQ